jgi:hypothetical protein
LAKEIKAVPSEGFDSFHLTFWANPQDRRELARTFAKCPKKKMYKKNNHVLNHCSFTIHHALINLVISPAILLKYELI